MLKLLESLKNAFLYDEMAAKRWIRGALGAGSAILGQVLLSSDWSTWTVKQWFTHLLPSVVSFAAGAVTAGDKTPDNVKALANGTPPAQP